MKDRQVDQLIDRKKDNQLAGQIDIIYIHVNTHSFVRARESKERVVQCACAYRNEGEQGERRRARREGEEGELDMKRASP